MKTQRMDDWASLPRDTYSSEEADAAYLDGKEDGRQHAIDELEKLIDENTYIDEKRYIDVIPVSLLEDLIQKLARP